jgi:1,4-dihydroxy-2-naphthoate octaprenyltransferase
MLTSVYFGIPFKVIYFFLPFLILSLLIIAMVIKGKHENGKILEILCGLNIAVNLGTSLSFILAYI